MPIQESIAIRYPAVQIGPFYDTDVAASQANADLSVVGAGNDAVPAVTSGWIVGLSWKLSAAGSAGTLTIGASVGGTEIASTTQTVTTAAAGYAAFPANALTYFAAGADLGVEITTDASWNGTTSDLDVYLVVVYEDFNF